MTIAPEASTTSQSVASTDGATAAISSPSMSTSPPGMSPMSGSMEMMWPPRSRVRAVIFFPTFRVVPGAVCVAPLVSGPRGGHRRLERDVELAGVERSVETAPRQFLLALVPGQRPDEGLFDRPYGVVIQVWVIGEEDLGDERLVSFRLHFEVYVRGPPGVLAGGLEQPAHGSVGRDRVRLGHHRLKLVAPILADAEPPPKVVVRLPLVPDVVATIRACLPDVEDRAAYGGTTVRRGDPAVDEEHVPVLDAFVLLVDLHRLLAPGRIFAIEWPLHVARRDP